MIIEKRIPVVGLGAGGHAAVLVEAIALEGKYRVVGLLSEDPRQWNQRIGGVPVLGSDEEVPRLVGEGIHHFFVGMGSVGDPGRRVRLFQTIRSAGGRPIVIRHPRSVISPSARLGAGVTVLAGAIVNTGAGIGDNVIINTGAIVEHHCAIDAHVHVAPRACLGGGVLVGAGSHIGMGSVICEGVRIGPGALVAAGAVVVSDVPGGTRVQGVPARQYRKIDISGMDYAIPVGIRKAGSAPGGLIRHGNTEGTMDR